MRRPSVMLLLLGGLAAICAVFAACGDDDSTASPSTQASLGGSATATPKKSIIPPSGARIANLLEDPTQFLAQFSTVVLTAKQCDYDKATGVLDCAKSQLGLIQLLPPLPEPNNAQCLVSLSGESPVYVRCTSTSRAFSGVYQIEG